MCVCVCVCVLCVCVHVYVCACVCMCVCVPPPLTDTRTRTCVWGGTVRGGVGQAALCKGGGGGTSGVHAWHVGGGIDGVGRVAGRHVEHQVCAHACSACVHACGGGGGEQSFR